MLPLICHICTLANFKSFDSFKNHLIDHKLYHSCDKCNKIIINADCRRLHSRKHAIVTCHICNAEYDKINSEEHFKYHNCLYSVDQLNDIVDIINQMNGINNSTDLTNKPEFIKKFNGNQPNCPVLKCNNKFKNRNDLINHFMYHRTNHLCKYCNQIFKDDESLFTHSRKQICRTFSCPICNERFSYEHIINHILWSKCDLNKVEPIINQKVYVMDPQLNNNNFRCFICEHTVPRIQTLRNHFKKKHFDFHFCEKCLSAFQNEEELINHYEIGCINDELEQLPLEVRIILRENIDSFLKTNKNQIENNMEHISKIYTIVDDVPMLQCHICKARFVKLLYLETHYIIHDLKLIFCSECLYIFETEIKLNNHVCQRNKFSIEESDLRTKFLDDYLRTDVDVKTPKKKCKKKKQETTCTVNINNIKVFNKCNFEKITHQDDILKRMFKLIYHLENSTFNIVKDMELFKEPSCNTTSSRSENQNDDYNLNKILPRIMQRRKNRFLKAEKEIENIDTFLNNLNISKEQTIKPEIEENRNQEFDLNKLLPRIIERRNKRLFKKDLDQIEEHLNEFASPTRNCQNSNEPPIKKNKTDSDLSNYLDEFEKFVSEDDVEDEIPNKKIKF